jgi:phosphatidylethanolamine/phosphatidyl-N-methylethanolamine N-methyltransferase
MANAQVQPHESKLYYELSPLYDLIFRRVFYPRIARVIASLAIPPGARVLELGVGTGLSLSAYPSHCDVVGVDLAPDMLEKAQEKIVRSGLGHVTVMQMDALKLSFPDNHFDYVTAFHVVSVVPDPVELIRQARRVCRPGGIIVVINHFRSEHPVVGRLAKLIDPMTRWLGWHATLRLGGVLDGVPLEIQQKYKTSPRSLFTVVVARNVK